MTFGDPELQGHGTRACWRRGCRQPECVEAERDYQRARHDPQQDLPIRAFVKAEPWMNDGACIGIDPEIFFIERGESAAHAKAVCAGCQVRDECLEFALSNGERFGIWGGKSERERRRLRRARRDVA